jgi:hypothetical protein
VPKDAYSDQGWLERGPRLVLTRLTQSVASRAITCCLYLALLCAAVYGVMHVNNYAAVTDMLTSQSHVTDYFEMDSK